MGFKWENCKHKHNARITKILMLLYPHIQSSTHNMSSIVCFELKLITLKCDKLQKNQYSVGIWYQESLHG